MAWQTSNPQRILIVRLTALGDVIHGMPVACALRDAFPQASISWVVEGGAGDLLDGHPAVDQVIRVPRRWLKSPRDVWRLRRRLIAERFDVTVDLQSLTKSAVAARLSGARRRIGAGGDSARELSGWLNNERPVVSASHVVDHYLGILAPLGIVAPQVRFDLPERAEDGRFADQAIAACRLQSERFVVLNPGAAWQSKLWPTERYGELAARLGETYGLPSLAVWGGNEEPLAEQIVASSRGWAHLAPSTRLRELAAVSRRARLFVGSDTGPMHLSVAVGTPTISLHGPSQSEWCGAYGSSNARVQAYYHEGTSRERRAATDAAMRAIDVDAVWNSCQRLLAA
ncbi:MAG: glycosyltransferase family 9 protein [Planctomycetales bacterium]|nr:glycosyltransferase family 9 protein [Planctomycetales bacterium]